MKIDLHPPHPCPPHTAFQSEAAVITNALSIGGRASFSVLELGAFSREGLVRPSITCGGLRHPVPIVWGASWIPRPDFGELVAAIFAFVASFERKRTIERVLAGLERARANGTTLGRPRVVVNREKVWRLRDSGRSIRDIAGSLKLSHGTVKRIA